MFAPIFASAIYGDGLGARLLSTSLKLSTAVLIVVFAVQELNRPSEYLVSGAAPIAFDVELATDNIKSLSEDNVLAITALSASAPSSPVFPCTP